MGPLYFNSKDKLFLVLIIIIIKFRFKEGN